MYYKLKPQYRLRGWDKLPCAIEDRQKHSVRFISPLKMETLKLCTGTIDLSLVLIPEEIRQLIPELEKEELIVPCQPGDGILPIQEYRQYPCRYIQTAHWSVTGGCNYRCKHCYMSAPEARFGQLDRGTVLRMAREIADCGIMNVSLTGGEPLIRPDFLDIVDTLLEGGVRITQIYSNGALVNESLLQALDRRNIHPEFNMSFDGVGWHDWLRGVPGAEEAVDRAFCLCRDMGFPTGAEMCIHRANLHTLRATMNHLRNVGCRWVKTCPVADAGEWRKNGYGESIGIRELFQAYLDYIPQYYEDGMPVSIMLGGFFSARPDQPQEYDVPLYHLPTEPGKCVVCAHARHVMYISPEGRALPCMSLTGSSAQERFPLIPDMGLARCITDSRYMDFIDTRADQVLAHNPECTRCEFRLWCQGGCRASGLADSGDLNDLLCRDPASCELFRGGWIAKIMRLMQRIMPGAESLLLKDEYWKAQSSDPPYVMG
ncbi:MAG: radical SAM protein [Clostridia bacterium]|nr:radical SAM protein [Clostridia bacterium]